MFNLTVVVRREDARTQSFHIVGEDEADPAGGTVSQLRHSHARSWAKQSERLLQPLVRTRRSWK